VLAVSAAVTVKVGSGESGRRRGSGRLRGRRTALAVVGGPGDGVGGVEAGGDGVGGVGGCDGRR